MLLKKDIALLLLSGILLFPILLNAQNTISRSDEAGVTTGKHIADNYTQLEIKANVAFTSGNFEEAQYYYEKALKLQPNAAWPASQLTKIEAKKIGAAGKDHVNMCNLCYTKHRTTADSALSKQAYSLAHAQYIKALKYKPTDRYAISQIAKLEKMEDDANYRLYMKRGTDALAYSLFREATLAFEAALIIRPGDVAAKKGLAAVASKRLQPSGNQQPVKKDVAMLAAYKDTLAVADELFSAAAYQSARNAYKKAEKLNPREHYPQKRIKEIDSLLTIRKQELEARKKEIANAALHTSTTGKADKAFEAGDLNKARSLYEAAQQLKTGDQYSTEKIATVDVMLREEDASRKSAAAAKTKVASDNSRFSELVAKANVAVTAKNYGDAKNYFMSALSIRPSETSIRSQVDLINKMLETQRIDAKYKYLIRGADSLAFKAKDKAGALIWYDSAHNLKPSEGYARTQIILINDQLSRSSQTSLQLPDKSERSDKFNEAFKIYRKADEARIEKRFIEAYTGFSSFLNQLDIANAGLYEIGQLYYINQAKDYLQQLDRYKSEAVEVKEKK